MNNFVNSDNQISVVDNKGQSSRNEGIECFKQIEKKFIEIEKIRSQYVIAVKNDSKKVALFENKIKEAYSAIFHLPIFSNSKSYKETIVSITSAMDEIIEWGNLQIQIAKDDPSNKVNYLFNRGLLLMAACLNLFFVFFLAYKFAMH